MPHLVNDGGARGTIKFSALIAELCSLTIAPLVLVFGLALRSCIAGRDMLPAPNQSWLEIAYYVANIAIAATAWVALRFARSQARNSLEQTKILAEQTRISANASKAEVYRLLAQDLLSPAFKQGADVCAFLKFWHSLRPFPVAGQTRLGDCAAGQIAVLRHNNPETFMKLRDFLAFLESLGLQVRRNYLSKDDLHYLLGETIAAFDDVLGVYLDQQNKQNPGSWEHTIWLFKTMRKFKPDDALPD